MTDASCMDSVTSNDPNLFCGALAVDIVSYLLDNNLSPRLAVVVNELTAPYTQGSLPVHVGYRQYGPNTQWDHLTEIDKRMLEFVRYSKVANSPSDHCQDEFGSRWRDI